VVAGEEQRERPPDGHPRPGAVAGEHQQDGRMVAPVLMRTPGYAEPILAMDECVCDAGDLPEPLQRRLSADGLQRLQGLQAQMAHVPHRESSPGGAGGLVEDVPGLGALVELGEREDVIVGACLGCPVCGLDIGAHLRGSRLEGRLARHFGFLHPS
jgi:hypothetical protein